MEMDKFKGLIDKVPGKDKLQNIVKSVSGKNAEIKALNNELEEKRRELDKTYGLIGMETYDLLKDGKYDIPQIKGYIDKIDDISAAIKKIETEIGNYNEKNDRKTICSCGCEVGANSHFCPNCGKMLQTEKRVCSCGAEIPEGANFCNICGRRADDAGLPASAAIAADTEKQCICGATVPAGQAICFECGRKVQ